jgi:hypothetical protein
MRRASILAVALAAALSGFLGGCSDSEPSAAACDSLEAVEHTIANLRNANVSENGMATFTAGVEQLKSDLGQLAADAQDEFKNQVDSVRSAADQLASTAQSAKADPTAANLSVVRSAYGDLRDAVVALGASMQNACAN